MVGRRLLLVVRRLMHRWLLLHVLTRCLASLLIASMETLLVHKLFNELLLRSIGCVSVLKDLTASTVVLDFLFDSLGSHASCQVVKVLLTRTPQSGSVKLRG